MHLFTRVIAKRSSPLNIIPIRGDGVGLKFRQKMSLPWAPKPLIRKKKGNVKVLKRERQRLRSSNMFNP